MMIKLRSQPTPDCSPYKKIRVYHYLFIFVIITFCKNKHQVNIDMFINTSMDN